MEAENPEQPVTLMLHPDAKKNFDERAEALLLAVSTLPRNRPKPRFVPNIPVTSTFSVGEDVGYQELLVLPSGKKLARTFYYEGNDVGFKDESYKNFVRMCESIQKCNTISPYVSLSMLEDRAFDWVKDRYAGKTSLTLTEYLRSAFEPIIRDYEVWIPIAQVFIERDLPIGDVTLKTFTETMFDALRSEIKSKNRIDEEVLIACLGQWQSKLQGKVAATMFVCAEPQRAYEIALEQSEKAIGILRFFSRAAIIPELSSCCVPLGQKEPERAIYLVFYEGMVANYVEGEVGGDDTRWVISDEQIAWFNAAGIKRFIGLFFKDQRNDLEEALYKSLMVHSRGLIANTPSDKLMYIFSALESLLLKSDQENIQQNIADRIAFVISSKAPDRLAIVKNYKDAYALRSKFVHHAQTVDDFETLTTFLQTQISPKQAALDRL